MVAGAVGWSGENVLIPEAEEQSELSMSVGEVKGMPSITAVKQGTVAPKWSQRREPEGKWLSDKWKPVQ